MKRLDNKNILLIIILSLAVKFALFSYAAINVPSAKFMPDTPTYIEPAINLIEKGVFATFDDKGKIKYENSRTPGYPIFIAFLNKVLGFSFDTIIIVQILLITFAGYIIYKTAYKLDERIPLLAAFIFLFDQPITISTLMLLTEALYTVFMALFIYLFLRYLREYKIGVLVLSVLTLAIATYIRPVSYYLAICLACGVLYVLFRINKRKAIVHAFIILLVFYSSLGLWQYRNYIRTGNADFSIIDDVDLRHMGLLHKYARGGGFKKRKMSPVMYYANRGVRYAIEFFTLPGTLKYFESRPIRVASKIYGYPWMVFWLIGLFLARFDKLEYRFLLLTVLYFMLVSILIVGSSISSRFRVPVMPLISILSASGWIRMLTDFKRWEGN